MEISTSTTKATAIATSTAEQQKQQQEQKNNSNNNSIISNALTNTHVTKFYCKNIIKLHFNKNKNTNNINNKHNHSIPVLNIWASERNLLEVEVAAHAEGADHVVDVDVHLRGILVY